MAYQLALGNVASCGKVCSSGEAAVEHARASAAGQQHVGYTFDSNSKCLPLVWVARVISSMGA